MPRQYLQLARQQRADLRTIAERRQRVVKAIKAGADDFLIKPIKSVELVRAVERALARHQTALEARREFDVLRARLATLTPRERQVFERVVRGKTNKQVARLRDPLVRDDGSAPFQN